MTVPRTERQLKLDVRYDIIAKMDDGSNWTAEQVAEALHLTIRQVFRLKAKVKAAGRAGLIHGNTGRKPAVALSDQLRRRAVDLYATEFAQHDYNYAQINHTQLPSRSSVVSAWCILLGLILLKDTPLLSISSSLNLHKTAYATTCSAHLTNRVRVARITQVNLLLDNSVSETRPFLYCPALRLSWQPGIWGAQSRAGGQRNRKEHV